ncbi:uncharacterized membrane protein [Paenibacillus popilliae ATCC 14706]|uniref:Uncharacterized membrane protein n=1 Tax=Paenibacillus popilliae ATCC 14706 TaxID=1212764 RepID=M9LLI7_PAEPP|nr:uncharacterized membrane protein [Paenibacillus popilliae ATCC 14706]
MVLENVLYLVRQIGINFGQPFGQIFVYRALGYAELFGDSANRMLGLDDAAADFYGPFFDVIVHVPASLYSV